MLTIFEGISCAGKTTLSQECSKSLAIPIFTESIGLIYKLNENYDFFDLINFGINKTILELVKKFNLDLILDRGFVSDMVSTSFFRHKNFKFQKSIYDELLSKLNYKVFYLSIDRESLVSRKRYRDQKNNLTEETINMWMKLQYYSKKLLKFYGYNVEFLDSTKPLDELINQVKKKIFYKKT